MFAALEAEFNAIVADGRSVAEKLESLIGLHARSATVDSFAPALTTIVEDAAMSSEQKVTAILTAVGKL
jgi:hypothetical protein